MVSKILLQLFIESDSATYDHDGKATENLSLVESNEEIDMKVISEEDAIQRNFTNVEIVWTLMVSCLNLIYKRQNLCFSAHSLSSLSALCPHLHSLQQPHHHWSSPWPGPPCPQLPHIQKVLRKQLTVFYHNHNTYPDQLNTTNRPPHPGGNHTTEQRRLLLPQ